MATFIGKSNNCMHKTDAQIPYLESNGPTCPVCDKSLGEPTFSYTVGANGFNPVISKNYKVAAKDSAARRKQLEEEWEGRRHRKPDSEIVIAATCGELFHKACLMKFCASKFKNNKRINSFTTNLPRKEIERAKDKASHSMPQCPRCSRNIVYTYHREIEIDSHRIKGPTEFDRDFTKTEIMGKELKDQYEKENRNLERIETVLADAELQLKQVKERQQKTNLMIPNGALPSSLKEDLKTLKKRKKEVKTMETQIEKAQKAIEYMQKETPVIMKMYLKQVKTRSRDDIIKNTPIPAIFIDYLDKICEDEFCLFALSQVIKPAPYPGTSFDENGLVSSILAKVDPAFKHKLERRASTLGHRDLLVAYENLYPEVDDKQTETTNELTKISSRLIKLDGVSICELYGNHNAPPSLQVLEMESMIDDVLNGEEEVSAIESKLSELLSKRASRRLDKAVEEILCSPTTEESDSDLSESAAPTEVIHIRPKQNGSLNFKSSESAFERSRISIPKLKKSKKSPRRIRKSSTSPSRKVESEELLRNSSSVSVMVSDYEGDDSYRPKSIEFQDNQMASTKEFIDYISNYDDYQATEWSTEEEIDLGKPETPKFLEQAPPRSDNDKYESSGDEASIKPYDDSLRLTLVSEAIVQQTEVIIAQCHQLMKMTSNSKDVKSSEANNNSKMSEIESESDPEAEYTPSGNLLCTVFKNKDSDQPTTGFLEFLSAKEIKEMKGSVLPPSPSNPVFVTCLAPNLSKFETDMNPHFPKAPEVVAYGPLKGSDGANLKVPLAYLGHYPPRHEVNRTWISQMESPTNVALGDWYSPPGLSHPPGYLLSPPVPPVKVTAKQTSEQFQLCQPFPQMAAYLSLQKQVGEAHSFYESSPTHHLNSFQPDESNVLPSKYSVMLSSLEMGTGQDDQVSSISKDVQHRVSFNVENEKTEEMRQSKKSKPSKSKPKQKHHYITQEERIYSSLADSLAMKMKEYNESERNRSRSTSISYARSNKSRASSKSPKNHKASTGYDYKKLDITTPANAASGLEEWNKVGMIKRSPNSISKLRTPRRNKSSDSVEPSAIRRLEDQNTERKRSLPGMRKTHFKAKSSDELHYYLEESNGGRKKLWKSNFFSGKSKQRD